MGGERGGEGERVGVRDSGGKRKTEIWREGERGRKGIEREGGWGND